MSLRAEQYNALARTREFMRDLLTAEGRPKTIKEMKERVWRCLKHFPPLTADGKPLFSRDPFGPDDLMEDAVYLLSSRIENEQI